MARAHVFFLFCFFKEKQKKVWVPWDPGWLETQQASCILLYRAQKLCAVECVDVSATVCGGEKKKKSLVSMLERDVREPLAGGLFIRVRE